MRNNHITHSYLLICIYILLVPIAGYSQSQKKMSKNEYQLLQYADQADSCATLGEYQKALEIINEGYNSVKRPQRYKDGFFALKIEEAYIHLMSEEYLDYDKAISIFREVESNHPSIAPLVFRDLGRAYLAVGDYMSAIHYLELALQDELEDDLYRILRSKVYLASAYIGIGDNDKAAEILCSFLDEQSQSLNHDDYVQLLVRAYYEVVVNEDGNIVWFDRGALQILRGLADDAKNKDASWYVFFVGQEAQIAQALGDFALAYECALEAIKNYTPECNRPLHSYYSIAATAASRLNRFVDAHNHLDHAAELLKNEADSLGAEYNDYVSYFEKQIKAERAILYLDEGINNDLAISLLEDLLSDENLSVDDRAQYLYNLGQAYESVDYYKAEDIYTQALSCYEQTEDNHGVFYAKTLNKLGQTALHTGGHENAIKYYELAIDIFRRRSDENNYSYALTLGNAALCAAALRQSGRALAWAEESRRLQKEVIGYMFPGVWEYLLRAYQELGNKDEYERVFSEYENLSDLDANTGLLYQSHLIERLLSDGNVEAAIAEFPKLDSLFKCYPTLNAELYYRTKNRLYPESDDLFSYYAKELADLDLEKNDSKIFLKSLGHHSMSKDDYASANIFFKKAYIPNSKDFYYLNSSFQASHLCGDRLFEQTLKEDILSFANEQFRSVVGLTEAEKEYAWMDSKQLLDMLFAYRDNDESDELLFDILLRTKNFALRSEDAIREMIASSNNSDLQQAAKELKQVKRLIIDGRTSMAPEVLDSLRLREIQINRYIANSLKDLSSFDALNGASFKRIVSQLNNGDIAIEIVSYPFDENNYGYGAFVLTSNADKPLFIELCTEGQLDQLVHIGPRQLYNKDLPYTNELYKLIWEPIAAWLPEKGQVFISADGLLNTIAFEAITTPENKYICDNNKIIRLSSTAELCNSNNRRQGNNAVVFGGINYDSSSSIINQGVATYSEMGYIQDRALGTHIDYLPGSKIEAENVAKYLRRGNYHTTLFMGENGTEEEFKSLSGSEVSIIHVATHGFYQPKDKLSRIGYYSEQNSSVSITPLQRSGLLMAGSSDAWHGKARYGQEDGVLTASEISGLDLSNTNLVVLSACESGLGEITDDGVAGLQRGFKNAGVKSLIMSLWNVDDKATEMLMSSFYSILSTGASVNDAFIQSREKMKTNRQFNDPFYWASFVILD